METKRTLTALIRKRAELAGRLAHHQALVRQLLIELAEMDASIRIFAPNINAQSIMPKVYPPRDVANHGDVARIVLRTLRDAKRACTTQELAMYVMEEWGMNIADRGLVRAVSTRIKSSLYDSRDKGLIQSTRGPRLRTVWKIADNLAELSPAQGAESPSDRPQEG